MKSRAFLQPDIKPPPPSRSSTLEITLEKVILCLPSLIAVAIVVGDIHLLCKRHRIELSNVAIGKVAAAIAAAAVVAAASAAGSSPRVALSRGSDPGSENSYISGSDDTRDDSASEDAGNNPSNDDVANGDEGSSGFSGLTDSSGKADESLSISSSYRSRPNSEGSAGSNSTATDAAAIAGSSDEDILEVAFASSGDSDFTERSGEVSGSDRNSPSSRRSSSPSSSRQNVCV